MIAGSQIREARMLLRWTPFDLAQRAGVPRVAIYRAEASGGSLQADATLSALQHALEAAGVEFTTGDEPGVRLRKQP